MLIPLGISFNRMRRRFVRDNGLFEDHCFEELKKELRGEEVVEPLNGSSNSEIHSESVRTSSENGVHEISVNKDWSKWAG